jgi:hypothetical protein
MNAKGNRIQLGFLFASIRVHSRLKLLLSTCPRPATILLRPSDPEDWKNHEWTRMNAKGKRIQFASIRG